MTINVVENKYDYYTDMFSLILSKLFEFVNLIFAIIKKILNHLIYKFNESAKRQQESVETAVAMATSVATATTTTVAVATAVAVATTMS